MNGNIEKTCDLKTLNIDELFGDRYRTKTIKPSEFALRGFRQSKEHYRNYIEHRLLFFLHLSIHVT